MLGELSEAELETRLQAASKDIHVFVKMAARMSASKLSSLAEQLGARLPSRFAQRWIRQAIAGQIMMRLAPILRHLCTALYAEKDKQLADFLATRDAQKTLSLGRLGVSKHLALRSRSPPLALDGRAQPLRMRRQALQTREEICRDWSG